jgi:hypothetical protein
MVQQWQKLPEPRTILHSFEPFIRYGDVPMPVTGLHEPSVDARPVRCGVFGGHNVAHTTLEAECQDPQGIEMRELADCFQEVNDVVGAGRLDDE